VLSSSFSASPLVIVVVSVVVVLSAVAEAIPGVADDVFAFGARLFFLEFGLVWILECLVNSSDLLNLFVQPG
jgi:hypothetical protein